MQPHKKPGDVRSGAHVGTRTASSTSGRSRKREPLSAAQPLHPLLELEAEGILGALHTPTDGIVNPSDACMYIVRLAREAGVRFVEHCGVAQLRAHGLSDGTLQLTGVPAAGKPVAPVASGYPVAPVPWLGLTPSSRSIANGSSTAIGLALQASRYASRRSCPPLALGSRSWNMSPSSSS